MTGPAPAAADRRLLLVTGASGYVGGRLLGALAQRGEQVRCLPRRPDELRAPVAPGVDVVGGDVLDEASLAPALAGVDTAFYLVHGMGSTRDVRDEHRRGAAAFARAARAAGVRRLPVTT